MNFIVSAPELLDHLTKVSGAIVAKPVIPILDNFLFDIKGGVLTISTTDLETSMSTSFNVEANGEILAALPSKLLQDIVKSLNVQPISITIDENTFAVTIKTDNGNYNMAGLNGEDFPKIPEINSDNSFTMPSNVLLRCISKTVFATGNDELRQNLTGVFVELFEESVNFVATDANRLVRVSRTDIKPGFEHSFILPKKALNLLKNSLRNDITPVQIDFNNSNVFFTTSNLNLSCRLIDDRYPDYKAVIPQENNNVVTINRIELLETTRRVANFANKGTYQIRMKIEGNQLMVKAEDIEMANQGEETRNCEYDGEDMEIGFNSKFLVEMIANLDNDQMNIRLSTPSKAGLLNPIENEVDEDVLMLVMPMMLNNY